MFKPLVQVIRLSRLVYVQTRYLFIEFFGEALDE